MPFWKAESKLAGRIFAILGLRPTIDKEEPSYLEPTSSLAGHDHSDFPDPTRSLPTSMIGLTATRTESTITQSDTSPSLSDGISSSDDPVHQVHNHKRYKTTCLHQMIIIHERQFIAFLAGQGFHCKWREILHRWRQFDCS